MATHCNPHTIILKAGRKSAQAASHDRTSPVVWATYRAAFPVAPSGFSDAEALHLFAIGYQSVQG